jgi:hypothetical protein
MKQLTDKQKKIAWIIALVLVVLHFANPLIMTIRQRLSAPAPAVFQKPATAAPLVRAQVAPPAPVVPPPAGAKFVGTWLGSALMPNQDTCQLRLEIRSSDQKPGDYTGFLTRRCIPTAPIRGGKINQQSIPGFIETTSPVSAVLSGPVVDGALQLRLLRAIGAAPDHCDLTDMTVSEFAEQIAAQWQPGSCPGGQMLLSKARG